MKLLRLDQRNPDACSAVLEYKRLEDATRCVENHGRDRYRGRRLEMRYATNAEYARAVAAASRPRHEAGGAAERSDPLDRSSDRHERSSRSDRDRDRDRDRRRRRSASAERDKPADVPAGFVFDTNSNMYANVETGMYYDPSTGWYYNGHTQTYCYLDAASGQLKPLVGMNMNAPAMSEVEGSTDTADAAAGSESAADGVLGSGNDDDESLEQKKAKLLQALAGLESTPSDPSSPQPPPENSTQKMHESTSALSYDGSSAQTTESLLAELSSTVDAIQPSSTSLPDSSAEPRLSVADLSVAEASGSRSGERGHASELDGYFDANSLRVVDLRKALQDRGLSTKGKKAELVDRLQDALRQDTTHLEAARV